MAAGSSSVDAEAETTIRAALLPPSMSFASATLFAEDNRRANTDMARTLRLMTSPPALNRDSARMDMGIAVPEPMDDCDQLAFDQN